MTSSILAWPRWGQNLRLRIGLGFALLALTIFSVVGGLSGQQARQQVAHGTGETLALVADRLAADLDNDMYERSREILNLAQLDMAVDGQALSKDPSRWRSVVDRLQQTHPYYAWIGIADLQGNVMAATDGALEGLSVASRPWFRGAQAEPYVGDVHPGVMLTDLLAPGYQGEPLRLVDVAAPVLRNGQLAAVIGAHLSWSWAEERRRRLIDGIALTQPGIDVVVLDHRGTQLLPASNEKDTPRLAARDVLRLARDGPGIATWSDGRDYFSAAVQSKGYLQYPGLGWMVAVRQPTDTALAAAHRVERQIWLLGLIGATLFGVLAWWLSGRLSAPLRALAAQAGSIVTGGIADPHRAEPPRDDDEVGQLAASLSALLRRLEQRSQELHQLNQSLEDRVHQRTQALESANDDLRSFSRSVSHDLKGPIGNIGLAVRQVLDREGSELPSPSRRTLQMVTEECERLRQLVDELLMLAQVEHQPLQRSMVAMDTLARQAAQRLTSAAAASDPALAAAGAQPQAGAVPTEWVFGALPPAPGDPVLLEQVWMNLLGNALKFSRKVAAPRIVVEAVVQGEELIYTVSDNGSGFDMSQAGRLFGVFQRLHRYTDFPGTGVGLSIVRRIVHRHGGRVWAESVPGTQTRFHFALPRRPEAVPAPAPSPTAGGQAALSEITDAHGDRLAATHDLG